MGVFDQLSRQGRPSQRQMDPRQMQQQMQRDISEIKAHPGQYLQGMGYSIPEGMTDAGEITQYLIRSRQIGTPRLQQVFSMLGGGRR